jgi:hypothetical protein
MKNIKKSIDWALKIVEEIPEKYQVSAFPHLLRFAFESLEDTDEELVFKEPKLKAPNSNSPLSEVLSKLPDAHTLATRGDRDQHVAWAIAELFSRNEEANNVSILEIIRDHLAISPPGRQNTNRSLRNLTPKYVLRTKLHNKFHYVPSAKLAEVFENLKDER